MSMSIRRGGDSIGMSSPEALVPSAAAISVDPALLARVVEIAAAQIAASSSPPSSSPPIVEATVQTTLTFPDGQYVGDVRDGQPHGRGTMQYYPALERRRYEGEWQEGEFHGRGLLIYSDGRRYEGQWENGLFHGQGVFIQADGRSRYEGEWQFGGQHGKGKFHISIDSSKLFVRAGLEDLKLYTCRQEKGCSHLSTGTYQVDYDGEFVGNRPQGKGVYKVSSYTYRGEFRDGLFHGRGYESRYRSSYDGMWEAGVKTGQGRLLSSDMDFRDTQEGVFRGNRLWEGTAMREKITYPYGAAKRYIVKDGVRQEEKKREGCSVC